MRLRANLAADAVIGVTTLIWGTTFVVAKELLESWPAVSYMASRLVLATALLVLLFGKRLRSAERGVWRAGALLGLLIGTGLAGQAAGLAYTTPSKAAFITGLTTPLVPFVAFLLLRARPSVENLVGVTLASLGGALILAPQGQSSINTGDLISLACTLVFAAHMTLTSRYAQRYDLRELTLVQIGSAALLLVTVWLGVRLYVDARGAQALPADLARNAAPLVWSARVVWQLLYLSIVATVVTFLLWTWGQARMSATHAAIIFSLEPVFATLFAYAVYGASEMLNPRAALGATLILAGVVVSELLLSKTSRDEDEGELESVAGESEEEREASTR